MQKTTCHDRERIPKRKAETIIVYRDSKKIKKECAFVIFFSNGVSNDIVLNHILKHVCGNDDIYDKLIFKLSTTLMSHYDSKDEIQKSIAPTTDIVLKPQLTYGKSVYSLKIIFNFFKTLYRLSITCKSIKETLLCRNTIDYLSFLNSISRTIKNNLDNAIENRSISPTSKSLFLKYPIVLDTLLFRSERMLKTHFLPEKKTKCSLNVFKNVEKNKYGHDIRITEYIDIKRSLNFKSFDDLKNYQKHVGHLSKLFENSIYATYQKMIDDAFFIRIENIQTQDYIYDDIGSILNNKHFSAMTTLKGVKNDGDTLYISFCHPTQTKKDRNENANRFQISTILNIVYPLAKSNSSNIKTRRRYC